MASIIQYNSDEQVDYLPLGKRTSVIGRSEALPLQVLDDQVSRKHLKIRYDESTQTHLASDMGSRNGVFVNDRKIAEETQLVEGDIICIGNTALFYTDKDFDDAQSALHHFKKVGERARPTIVGQSASPPGVKQ